MLIKKVVVEKANRLFQLPPDITSFVRNDKTRALIRRGELIDLAGFSWPVPAPDELVGSPFARASAEQIAGLKEVIAEWFSEYHGVKINPVKEIYIGDGISRMILTMSLALLDNGDIAFVPELGLPLYKQAVAACGAESVSYTISARNNWQPGLARVGTRLGRVARLLFLNSPHNPTGGELSAAELSTLVWTASKEHIVLVNDAAYASISGRKPVSLMSVSGGKKVGVEAYSFAYNFGLPAVPYGFVVGNREVINAMKLASHLTRTFIPEAYIQPAIDAVRKYPSTALTDTRKRLVSTSAEATKMLNQLGLERAGFETVPFIWARSERRSDESRLADRLYRRFHILAVPGPAFGETGEGYVRFSLTAAAKAYADASARARKRRIKRTGGDDE